MIIILGILIVEMIALYIKGIGIYTDALNEIDKKEYSIKMLLPIGLYFLEIIKYSYSSSYDRKLYKKFCRLKGKEKANFYRIIHLAEKVVYMHIALLIVLIFGVYMEKDIMFFIFSVSILFASLILKDREIDNKIDKKYFIIRNEFAEFLNKLSLLVGAGLTITGAWKKIANTCDENHPFYRGVVRVQRGVDNGQSFNIQLENFQLEYQTREISRFVSILIQNYLKGSENIVIILDQLSNEALEGRKREVKIIGERVNSKLLLPMMITLIAIFIMLAIPAILMIKSMI
jgi:tight adherence protein C